ncbi:ATP-grasp domain-containing protein [Parabacteroides sp. ZJ-118]|uniref:ATP-grasp domain-containing protein n=1 Tax=Parabacteroides sp. ZJ-118 TaxID=2709398 RepID=UPI0013ED310C|nr:ATP-grasp domain-containing protein [Parabacteroides sp. ZJ-118]
MNILFTCAGRRTYLLKYFKEQLGDDGLIIGADMQLSAPALSAADIKEQVPTVYADNYIDCVLDICRRHDIRTVISLNDLELPILSANRGRFEKERVTLLVSRQEVIDICFDKYRTAEYVASIGLNTPLTFVNLDKAKEAITDGKLAFPLVLKPRWGSGSIGIEFVNDIEELEEVYAMLLKKVKKSILATASQGDEYILIQEKIEGQEYGLDVMNDLRGNNRGVSVKKKLAMRAGETDKAQTVDNPAIRNVGHRLGEQLRHIGNLDVDVSEKDGIYYVLELNPRFGGGFPFSYEAGVNFPKAIIEWLKGNEINNSILIPTYGKTFAKCDYLVSTDN